MPTSLYPTDEEKRDDSVPGRTPATGRPGLTREQRAALMGMGLGILLCAIIAWVAWSVHSAVTHQRSVPLGRVASAVDRMLETAGVTVTSKDFISPATEARRVEGSRPVGRLDGEFIRISGELTNRGSRDIRAIRGDIVFTDVFGEEIKRVSWADERGVKAGKRKPYDTEFVYDGIILSDQKLRNTPLVNMTVRWDPQVILFADGESLRK